MTGTVRRRTVLGAIATAAVLPLAPGVASATTGGTPLAATLGRCDHDIDPRTSTLVPLGADTAPLTLDHDHRSVGADLGAVHAFTAVALVLDGAGTDTTGRDWSLHVSDDNRRWTRVRDARIIDLGGAIWFAGLGTTARYVKVHCHRGTTDESRSTVRLRTGGFRVYDQQVDALIAGNGGTWRYRTAVTVTNPHDHEVRDGAAYLTFSRLGLYSMIAAGQVSDDLADVRCADADGRYLHAYADAHGLYLRIPRIAPRGSVEVTLYSGNPVATDVVHGDAAALQVEYGVRTLVQQPQDAVGNDYWGEDVKPVRLPTGVVALLAGGDGTVRARYSDDDGRTFSTATLAFPQIEPGVRRDSMGSAFVDPATGVLTVFFYSLGYSPGPDWLDESDFSCRNYVIQARSYDSAGRPVFGEPRRIRPISRQAGVPVAWTLTYTNILKTSRGSYLNPIAYAYRSAGTFAVSVFRSTDAGETWQQSPDELVASGDGFEVGISETAIAELADGRIILMARQQGAGRYYFATSTSTDDGVTWTPMTHSEVLATNTFPAMFRDDEEDLVLSWAGFNGFGQDSYYRNAVTLAYKPDDAGRWQAYQDLLAGHPFASPGWHDSSHRRRFVETDSTAIGDDTRLFSWMTWTLPMRTPYSLLVEDFGRFLKDSRGALDIGRYRADFSAYYGGELNSLRWLRTLAGSSLDLVPGRRPVGQAVRLRGLAGRTVAASRLFPGLRRGRVRFAVRWSSVGAGLRLCLQEGYSADPNSRGTVASLRLMPDGRLLATQDDRFDLPYSVGYCTGDSTPAAGELSNFGQTGLFALDYRRRSIGARFNEPTTIDGITVLDNDSTSAGRPGTRLKATDLTVWISDTNQGDWRQPAGWTASGTGGRLTLSGPAVTTRYVKVNQSYADDAFTFVNDFRSIIELSPRSLSEVQVFNPLPVPATVAADRWTQVELDVDLDREEVAIVVDGITRGRLAQVHAAQTVTHLLVLGESGQTGVEVAVDELLVQDVGAGVPVVAAVSRTRSGQPVA